jgi:phage terminase small subunit
MNKNNYSRKLSAQQHLFCQYVAEGINPSRAAVKAGYSSKGNRSRACRLMKRDEIKLEIRRLQEEMASPRIMSVQKRKERLSEIARAKMSDYYELVNGSIIWKVDAEKLPTDVISKMKTVTKTDKFGITTITTSIILSDPIKAIHELNKMDGLYKQRPEPQSWQQPEVSIVVKDPSKN